MTRRAPVVELLGEMFDVASPRSLSVTIGEQAERRRRRESIQRVGLELLREALRATAHRAR